MPPRRRTLHARTPLSTTSLTVDPPELATLEELVCVLQTRGRGLQTDDGTYTELNARDCRWTRNHVQKTVDKWRGYSDDDLQLRVRRYALPARPNPVLLVGVVLLCVYACMALAMGAAVVSPLGALLNGTMWNALRRL